MPRKGKGQQAAKTATGQQYGQAKAQEEAQSIIPLPKMEPGVPSMRPGEVPFQRSTERPNEPITSTGEGFELPNPEISRDRRAKVLSMLPVLEQMASQPFSSPKLRNLVREMKLFVGPLEDM